MVKVEFEIKGKKYSGLASEEDAEKIRKAADDGKVQNIYIGENGKPKCLWSRYGNRQS